MAAEVLHLVVGDSGRGERLDGWLAKRLPQMSRTYLARLVEDGHLTLDGQEGFCKTAHRLQGGEEVVLEVPEAKKLDIQAEDIPIEILYEDNELIIVNKPCGMVVHPVGDLVSGTLVNALLDKADGLAEIGGVERPGIVHRLDKETTGIMVVAKTDNAHRGLGDQFRQRMIDKRYLAIAKGVFLEDSIRVHAPIGRHGKERHKMAVVWNGRHALTVFHAQERFAEHTLVRCDLYTGRTHQIRVHLKHIHYPILGDHTYGGGWTPADESMGRVGLHAWQLGFFHPTTGKRMDFTAEPPEDFQAMVERLRKGMV